MLLSRPNREAACLLDVAYLLRIWKEQYARVFRDNVVLVEVLVAKIKEECSIWSLAGAKHLCNSMQRLRLC